MTGMRCRWLGSHEPHEHIGKDGIRKDCPGVPCDHDRSCCMRHRIHAMPHVGCILR